MLNKRVLASFAVLLFALATVAGKEAGTGKSTISEHNIYVNSPLGFKAVLPGKWHFTRQSDPNSDSGGSNSADPNCRGPLCGKPQVDEVLETDSAPTQSLFLIGFKLKPEYLDRHRYPLNKFAEIMLQGSLGGSSWQPVGGMVETQLAGRNAYKLLVHDPTKPQKKGFGFVFEANGYMCLLIGSDITESQSLLPAIEHMTATKE